MDAADLRYEDITVGASHRFRRLITAEDVGLFADVTGDHNPLHVDDRYAAGTSFERPIVHGMLLGGLLSRLVGMHLPGRRCLLLNVSLDFREPVYPGDEVEVRGVVKGTHDSVRALTLHVSVDRVDGVTAVKGKVTVKVLE